MNAQTGDVAFGIGTVTSPQPSQSIINSGNFFAPSIGGGAYLSFTGDFLLKHDLGVGGEISWRASQNLYLGFQPYRPLFFDVNGIWAPRFGKYFGVEALAGIGAESSRFYTGYNPNNCNSFVGCTNYESSNHFMGVFGGGLKFYPHGNIFIRPEVRVYLVHNNVEFSSSRVVRSGLSIGYTFGGSSY
jgi:hypothetical protein